MKTNYLFAIFLTVIIGSLKAEVINGPANFRLNPNKRVLASLNDGVSVECAPISHDWFEISFTIKITKQQYDKGYIIKKGEKLVDNKNRTIGVALADIPVSSTSSHSYGLNSSANYEMEVFGYVFKSNIKENSIPENVLDSMIKKEKFQYDTLKNLMVKNGYNIEGLVKKTLPNIKEYCISESTVVDPSPGFRIGLIFEGKNLIAIKHSRPINSGKFRDYKLNIGNTKICLIKPPKNLTAEAFIKKINESYIGAD